MRQIPKGDQSSLRQSGEKADRVGSLQSQNGTADRAGTIHQTGGHLCDQPRAGELSKIPKSTGTMRNTKRILVIYYIAFFAVVVLGKLLALPFFAGLGWGTILFIATIPVIATLGIGFLIFLILCVWYLVNDKSKWEE